MTRPSFAAIGLLAGLTLGSGCGRITGPTPTGPPPAVIGPGAVLLRPPNASGHTSFEVSVAFSPDGRTVAVGRMESSPDDGDESSSGTVVSLIEVASGRERATIRGPFGESCSVAFSPDGRTLAVGLDRAIMLHDPVTGAYRAELTGEDSYDGSLCLAFSPDSRRLAATTMLGDLVVWDLATNRQSMNLNLRTRSAEGVAVSPDGRLVATAAQGPIVCRTSFFGLFGGSIACGPGPGVVRVFDLDSGRQRSEWKHGYTARSVAFSPDGKTLASGGGAAKLWDLATGDAETLVEPEGGLAVYCVAFSPDGGTMAVGLGSTDFRGSAGEVRLWDVANRRVRAILRGEAGKVRSLAFAPDGRTLVSGSREATMLWKLEPGTSR